MGLGLGPGPQLLGPGDVLVDVRLDGLAALRELLVELLPPLHGLVVQLGLQPGLVFGVLLQDPLRLRPGVTELALGVGTQLFGLDLGITEQLFGLVADVRAVVRGTGREIAPSLVQLGAQDLDLVTEVLGVLDGLLPVGLQPIHLGFEPREVVVVSSVALLAFVAPHCAVPSVPWSQLSKRVPFAA